MRLNNLSTLVLLACCAFFGVALAAFAYTGTFTRYWADDYCYNAVLNQDGFWKGQLTFYQYTSDRYSVIPLVGASEAFGPHAIRFWPLAAILLGLGAASWAIRRVTRLAGWNWPFLHILLGAEILLFFTFWQAPNLFQALYWRTGMLTYFMPLVFLLVLAGIAVPSGRERLPSAWTLALVGALAFFAGGFSETTAALQMGAVLLALAGTWLLVRSSSRAQAALRMLLAAFAGTLLAMVALYASPANAHRLTYFEEQAGPVALVTMSLRFALDFILDTFSSQPLPTAVSVAAALALGMLFAAYREDREAVSLRRWLEVTAAALAAMYLLLVCVMAPSVYIQVAYPEYRALIAARLVMTAGLAAAGWFTGFAAMTWAARRAPSALLALGAALLLAFLSLYPLRAASILYHELPAHSRRAADWDQRDQDIRMKRSAGELDLAVVTLDSVAGLMELLPEDDKWPNTCMAGAYQVRSITGIQP